VFYRIFILKLNYLMHQKGLLLIMILFPAIMSIFSSYALQYEQQNRVTIWVVDEDLSLYSSRMIAYLERSEGISITLGKRSESLRLLRANQIEALIVIHPQFGQWIKENDTAHIMDITSSPMSKSAGYIMEVLSSVILRMLFEEKTLAQIETVYEEKGLSFDDHLKEEVQQSLAKYWEPKPLFTVDYSEVGTALISEKEKSIPSAKKTANGMMALFLTFFMLYGGVVAIEERMNGTTCRMLTVKGGILRSFLASFMAQLLSAHLILLLFTIVVYGATGEYFVSDLFEYGLWGLFMMAMYMLAIGISSFFRSIQRFQGFIVTFSLLTGILGGCFWSLMDYNSDLKMISHFTLQGLLLNGLQKGYQGEPILVYGLLFLMISPIFLWIGIARQRNM
jgi:ABC-2 type transport system permease protein